jgi:hypothetical protein
MIMADNIGAMGTNINEAWFYSWPLQAYGGGTMTMSSAGGTTHNERAWIRVRKNKDKAALRFKIFAKQSSGTGIVRLYSGVSVVATINVSSSTAAWYETTVTDSSTLANDPLDLSMTMYRPSGTLTVYSYAVYVEPQSAVTTGVQTSGFKKWDSSINAYQDPISSEMVQRLIQAPYQIAKDRTTSLYSMNPLWNAWSSNICTNATQSYATVVRAAFIGDGYERTYRIDAHVSDVATYAPGGSATGDTPALRIRIKGVPNIEKTGTGWQTETFTTSETRIPFEVDLKNNTAARGMSLDALIIRREPS